MQSWNCPVKIVRWVDADTHFQIGWKILVGDIHSSAVPKALSRSSYLVVARENSRTGRALASGAFTTLKAHSCGPSTLLERQTILNPKAKFY